MLAKRLVAEFIGTLWLVLGGCGSAMYAAAFPEVGIGLVGVSFAFGLTVLTMAYAVGGISGGHFNPGNTAHGFLAEGGPHAGDMPNQMVGADGALHAEAFNPMVRLKLSDATPQQHNIVPSSLWRTLSDVLTCVCAETL